MTSTTNAPTFFVPSKARRRRLGTSLIGAVAAVGLTAGALLGVTAPSSDALGAPRTWYVDANTHHANRIQENSVFSDGDEFYVATIAFRTTPGRRGSTSAWFHGGLREIDDIDRGETHRIPDVMGRVPFPNVTTRSATEIVAGQNPEIIGTLALVFESDATPLSTMSSQMNRLAPVVQTEIARITESSTLADLTNRDALAGKISTAINNIKSQATPSFLGKVRLFLGSFGDPDDLVGFRLNAFVAVEPAIADQIDASLSAAVPASTGVAGALRPRTFTQRFSGADAVYDLGYEVS